MCFRCADRAGQSYGPTEPDVKYELCGPLYQTGRPLAAAGQPKGKVTNNLLQFLQTLRAASRYLHFSVFGSDTDLNCPSGSSFSLLHTDVNSSCRHRCHLMFVLKARFSQRGYHTDHGTCYSLFSLSLWHFYEHWLHLL